LRKLAPRTWKENLLESCEADVEAFLAVLDQMIHQLESDDEA